MAEKTNRNNADAAGMQGSLFGDVDAPSFSAQEPAEKPASPARTARARAAELNRILNHAAYAYYADRFEQRGEDIWVAKSATVFDSAYIGGPCIIDEDATIRQCAFIRGSAIVGKGTTVGNSTELKNVILFNKVEVPHYNYVGDSVLGFHAHMGAGSITSNVKADKKNIMIHCDGTHTATGLRKIGAILGDWVDVGCNSVLNPGSVVGPHTNIYPLSMIRGTVPAWHVYKDKDHVVEKIVEE